VTDHTNVSHSLSAWAGDNAPKKALYQFSRTTQCTTHGQAQAYRSHEPRSASCAFSFMRMRTNHGQLHGQVLTGQISHTVDPSALAPGPRLVYPLQDALAYQDAPWIVKQMVTHTDRGNGSVRHGLCQEVQLPKACYSALGSQ
jgi:hypothetical protein